MVSMRAVSKERPSLWAHAWWLASGALLGLGVGSILTIGIFVLPVGIALVVVGALAPRFCNRSALAAVAGLALPVLYIAWLNKGGPGEVCTSNSTGTSCTDAWSPWPFVAVGLFLLAAPAFVTWLLRTRD